MPSAIQIRLEGFDRLQRKLGQTASVEALRKPMDQSLALVQGEAKIYPPPPPHSSYRRTRKLGQSWALAARRITRQGVAGLRGRIGTERPYARDVQDEDLQAPIHRGRWPTIQKILEENRSAMLGFFRDHIRKLLGE